MTYANERSRRAGRPGRRTRLGRPTAAATATWRPLGRTAAERRRLRLLPDAILHYGRHHHRHISVIALNVKKALGA